MPPPTRTMTPAVGHTTVGAGGHEASQRVRKRIRFFIIDVEHIFTQSPIYFILDDRRLPAPCRASSFVIVMTFIPLKAADIP